MSVTEVNRLMGRAKKTSGKVKEKVNFKIIRRSDHCSFPGEKWRRLVADGSMENQD